VVIATERVRRPADFAVGRTPRPPESCLLCGGREAETPPERLALREKSDAGAPVAPWRVRVVPNKFPVLRGEGALERRGEGVYDLMSGVGAHELIVESPAHDVKLADLPATAVGEILGACRTRIRALRQDPRLRAALLFKRHDPDAIGRARHPQCELLATPVVSEPVVQEMEQAKIYHDYRERCLFCDILRQELDAGLRLVAESEHAVALAPFAARAPFEVWLLPRRHRAAFEDVEDAEQADVAALLRTVLRKLDRTIGDPAFELVLHSAPFGDAGSPAYHWHVEIVPAVVTGDRGSVGLVVNPMPPEDAARFLREAGD
jgi:UDPglucose--hexose-1-phosphate uridylyltransferase